MALTIGLCFCAALVEGLDIVAAGIVAPLLVPAFGLTPSQAGWLFSSSTIGLMIGAVFGGWLADRIGRKRVLVASMLVFGAMTLATAFAGDNPVLFGSRLLTGLGLGGAMPNLIALSAEAGPPRLRTTLVTLMFSGVPLGGALGGAIALWGGANRDWRILFYVGGSAPLILAVLLAFLLPESRLFQEARRERARLAAAGGAEAAVPRIATVLFGEGRAAATVYLALSFFCTLVAIYLLINWLPLLLVGKGFTRQQAAITLMVFNTAGGIGAVVLGLLMDRVSPRAVMAATYAGMIASLWMLLHGFRREAPTMALMAATSFTAGFFVIGAQLVLYGIAPRHYATPIRATGVGSAVAAGRVGAIVGPLIGGQMLGAGGTAAGVVTALLPCVLIAGVAALLLVLRPRAGE